MRIQANRIAVEFPVFDNRHRSIRHAVLFSRLERHRARASHGSIGGEIGHDASGRVYVKAIEDVSFAIEEGDRVGLIGVNGAGKTTLLRTIAGIYEPVRGIIQVSGRVMPLFNINDGIDMDATGREAIRTRGILMGLSTREIREAMEEVIDFTELGDYVEMPIRTYSSGMLVRLSFAVATAIRPEILLLDEIIGVGDAHFLEKAQARLSRFLSSAGILVISTHSMDIVKKWCNKAILMHKGRVVMMGEVDETIAAYGTLTRSG
jgi:ABC-type polysaccharide/polyol phosphate transport system ATPase subunit